MLTLEEQILAAANGDNSEGQQQTAPITVDLGNGNVLSFKNSEQLSTELRTALAQVNQEVTTLKQQQAEYEARLSAQNNSSQYVQSDNDVTPKFDANTFIEKFRQDPVTGMDYLDNFRESPYKQDIEELRALKQEREVEKFLAAHPYFPGGDQYARILNATREELKLPFNKAGLEAAMVHATQTNRMPDFRLQAALQAQQMQFAQLLQQQGIQLPQVQQPTQYNNVQPQTQYIQQQPFTQQPYNPQSGGIPTVPRNQPQNVSGDVLQAAEKMTKEQLEDVLRQYGML